MDRLGKRRQPVKVLTEEGGIADAVLGVGGRYASSPKSLEAWGLNRLQQVKDKVTGKYVQFISEVSYNPLVLWPGGKEDKSVKANINTIASQAVDDELAFVDERSRKNSMTLYLGIIAGMLTLGLLIFIYMQMSQHGGVSLPGIKLK